MREQLDQLYESVKEDGESLCLMWVCENLYLERMAHPPGGQYQPRPFLEDEFWYHEDEFWSNADSSQVIEFKTPSLASLEDLHAIFVLSEENYLDVHELGTDCELYKLGDQTLEGTERKLLASDIIAKLTEPYRSPPNWKYNTTVEARVLVKEWRCEGKLKGVLVMLEQIVPGPCPYCKNRKRN